MLFRSIIMLEKREISSRGAKDIIAFMVTEGGNPRFIADKYGLFQKNDEGEIKTLINSVLEDELEVDYKVTPRDYLNVPILVNDKIKILNVVEDIPEYEPKCEEIYLYKYDIVNDNVVFYYEKKQKEETVKTARTMPTFD